MKKNPKPKYKWTSILPLNTIKYFAASSSMKKDKGKKL
jgi:hypothetical protein